MPATARSRLCRMVLSTLSRLMINRYEANGYPCGTPAIMTKLSVSPSGERTFAFVFLYSIIMAATVFFFR